MPLPLFLGIAAAIAAAGGIGTGIHGAIKMKDANDTMKYADERHKKNMSKFESQNKETAKTMDTLGKKELDILSSFETFSDLFEKIKNRPDFGDIVLNGTVLPKYDCEELKKVSVGAGALLGGLGGAALGTAGGFAAAGATSAAVMALGTASTGTTIASLSGAAATNATLALLGGGALAAGGGGIALGTTMLGVATAGVGLLVGGVIFSITGSSISKKADDAYFQMIEAEKQINTICSYLKDLKGTAANYLGTLRKVDYLYTDHLSKLKVLVLHNNKTDWNTYTDEEKLTVKNTVLLVGLLYEMCKVQLVLQSGSDNSLNKVNHAEITEVQKKATAALDAFNSDTADTCVDVTETLTQDELYCIALVAFVSYSAKYDGKVTDYENQIIADTTESILTNNFLSDTARNKINTIMSFDVLTFEDLCVYLDPVELERLKKLSQMIDNVINMNDDVTLSCEELAVKEKFSTYLQKRSASEDSCSFKARVNTVHEVHSGISVGISVLKGSAKCGDTVYLTDKSGNKTPANIGRMYKDGHFASGAIEGDSLTVFFEGSAKDSCEEGALIIG